ncbi:hypothetical protein FBU30_003604 [Linnemannia zychae]|nr:hypothetical protein FBU30_003604 [Linnemannia zychae]
MKEKDLLSSFLVGNELHDSVTLTKFASYFPAAYRSNPEIKDLYRAYMNSRHQIRSKVRRNIEIESRRNPFHTTPEQQQQHEQRSEENIMDLEGFDELVQDEIDLDMDIEDVDKHLTLDLAIHELMHAEKVYKKEIEQLEQECNAIAKEFQELDQEVSTVKIPSRHLESVNEVELASELENLITMCNSLTSEISNMK